MTTMLALFALLLAEASGAALRRKLQPDAGSVLRLRADFPFYHTSQELQSETARLVDACNGAATTKSLRRGNVSIDEVRLRSSSAKPANRVSIVFGEHSRELISPETGLMLLKMLCGDVPSKKDLVQDTLKDSEFQLILNANPLSRAKVEGGDYCLRANPAGVDLNRNWDDHWDLSKEIPGSDQYPGESPFSEPESQAVRDLVTDFKPTTFLSVHSGTLGLYMPWAYDSKHMATRNRDAMLSVLKELDADHCQCPFGAAGKEVGYDCPGTSFDWVYDKLGTPFSFAWEIFANPLQGSSLHSRWEEKIADGSVSLLERGHSLEHAAFAQLYQGQSDFVHRSNRTAEALRHKLEEFECFATFNPGDKKDFDESVKNWATSYVRMAQLTAPHVIRLSQAGEQ